MIKAIFFDIDGTLLSHASGGVPQSARTAISILKRRGVKVFPATGRHILEIRKLPVGDLPFDGYVTLNGQLCLNARQEITRSLAIAPQDAEKLISVFRQRNVPVQFVEQDRMYINFVNDAVRFAQKAISTPIPPAGVYTGGVLYQCNVYDNGPVVDGLIKELPSCKMSRWNPYAVDIIPKEGGKVAGIRSFLADLGISPLEVMAFGDGENDMEMLKFAGTGVAMGSAVEAVRTCADYVTDDIDQDGVCKALEHFGLL